MTKLHKPALLGLLLGLGLTTASTSYGTTFDFSYEFSGYFGAGTMVTGTLNGTQNGNIVDVNSVLDMTIGGYLVSDHIYATSCGSSGWVYNNPVVSFDGKQNNFGSSGRYLSGE
jgi:hypothetical protein